MEMDTSLLTSLDNELTRAAAKNTYSYVVDKVKNFKASKDKDEIIRNYEELVNELLEEKSQLERVAKSYKELYENMEISDRDLEHLQKTIRQVATILISIEQDPIKRSLSQQSIEPLLDLVNADTLRTMQLLGFNYKKAIGEPLTEVCYDKVKSLIGGNSSRTPQRKK